MPYIEFNKIEDSERFTPVPAGEYLCEIVRIDESLTQYGDEMWRIRFMITEGDHKGRYIFDNMVFSRAAMSRVKLMAKAMGVDTSKSLNLESHHLMGILVFVTVTVEEYITREGEHRQQNRVPFNGYRALTLEERKEYEGKEFSKEREEELEPEGFSEEDLPF